MKLILKRVHTNFYRYNVALFFTLCYPVLHILKQKLSRYRYINGVRKFIIFLSSSIAGIFYSATFEETIDWKRTYVICGNHTSNLDVSALNTILKNNICFMGKEELLTNYVTGYFFRTIDITVNRESKMSSFRAFKTAAERIKNGISVVIFPEATIPEAYPPELHPFKNGPFRLAIEMKVPILPITSLDTWKVLWDDGKELGSRPGICDIFVHKPIETAHLSLDDADALRDEVFNIIDKKLRSA
ncbi:lysophospholipid acyltransferase family protein [Mucilaginibacter flavus]|uniref:lysophospholipid acyltransferase family protein n=1 Tax=Mucilaginibacter flavus TaxID=931504 RepID=UPI0025B47525|nr:lysophospholipid acyltransferase family protein [Mucilaginibacter flavus]MDN3579841.1 lysophospholipid acyltransferase family protein [Mucilaginibacter flavus]